MYRHGLIVGKFYPPHAGHHHLVAFAASRCRRLTVLVCASRVETIPLASRAAWMREEHPEPHIHIESVEDNVPVVLDDAAIWDAHMAIFRAALNGASPDAIFTSEAYGNELARRFGAVHVPVDPDRKAFPISGTAIRRDPAAHWRFLRPAVRAGLAVRVAVVGAESTGTTTLARALADRHSASYVPEYGRAYWESKYAALPEPAFSAMHWTSSEFLHIARTQRDWEEEAARTGGPLIVCDTDTVATAIWHERYLGFRDAGLESIPPSARLWIVTDHEGVAFMQDGTRDGEQIRAWMTGRFVAELTRRRAPWMLVTGAHEHRMAVASTAINRVLASAWRFAEPI